MSFTDRALGAISTGAGRLREHLTPPRERTIRAARRRAAAVGANAGDMAHHERQPSFGPDNVWQRAEDTATMAAPFDATLEPVTGVEEMGAFATGEIGESGGRPKAEAMATAAMELDFDDDSDGDAFPGIGGATDLDDDYTLL